MSGPHRRPPSLPPGHSGEAVGAPRLGAHAVMHEEEAGRVILLLDAEQPRIVRAPVGVLPLSLEEAAFRDVGSGMGDDPLELIHGVDDPPRIPASISKVRLVTA